MSSSRDRSIGILSWETSPLVAVHHLIVFLLLSVLYASGGLMAHAQDQSGQAASQPGQTTTKSGGNIEAVPDRPTFSSTAETVQGGVLEIEAGFESAEGHQDINGLLKFGLSRNLEIRLGDNPLVRNAGVFGFGDSGAGFKYRFLKDKGFWPTISVLYTLTIPTETRGVESNATGHSAGLPVSKELGRHHLDFNESIQWVGREGRSGFDRNYFTALCYSHPITEKLGFSEEIAGFSRTNATIGPTLTILQTLTYAISPRLVLDGGCYVAAMGDLPRVTFFAGVTYAVAGLYRHWRHPQH